MFSIGALLGSFGYALIYTGIANILNGGNGPSLWESLGFAGGALAPPGADKPQRQTAPLQLPPNLNPANPQNLNPFTVL